MRLALSVVLAVAFAAALWPYLRAVPADLSIAAWTSFSEAMTVAREFGLAATWRFANR